MGYVRGLSKGERGTGGALLFSRSLYFSYFLALGALYPFLNLYFKRIGLSGLQIGLLASISALMSPFAAPLWAGLADRFGVHRHLLTLAMMVTLMAGFSYSLTSLFALLFLIALIHAFFDSAIGPIMDSAALEVASDRVGKDLAGFYIGTPEEAYEQAADLSAKLNIIYVDRTFERVLSMAPKMYDDLWTAAKAMYKVEPVVADGGEVIIYASHITEVSYTHGKLIDQIGYHTRDYFLKQMDRFGDIPKCVLAHSTHLKGLGTFEGGVERTRIRVTLATGIPKARC